MRDEGLVILEWVAHYRVLGFDTIFIYTNDNTDGSDDLLLALHRAGVITWTQNVVPEELSPQMKAYRHAFWHSAAVWEHDWVAFLDADEFLIPLLNGAIVSVGDYVAHLEELGASSISLNWRWFSGDGEFAPKAGLLPERYRKALPDYHVKSLFRLRDAASISIHHAEMVSGLTLNGNGQPRVSRQHQEPPAYMLGHVNHYWNRSFQEYYIKQRRGRGSSDRALRDISAFFLWGQTGDTRLEPHPGPEHIVRMHAEIENLRSLPGVAAADRAVRDAFLRKVESPHVRTLYDEGKLKPESVS